MSDVTTWLCWLRNGGVLLLFALAMEVSLVLSHSTWYHVIRKKGSTIQRMMRPTLLETLWDVERIVFA